MISTTGLIGFKLQGLVIRCALEIWKTSDLFCANRTTLDIAEVRDYFRLFGRESLLDDLLRQID